MRFFILSLMILGVAACNLYYPNVRTTWRIALDFWYELIYYTRIGDTVGYYYVWWGDNDYM